jgi:hypothetical protein
MVRKKCSNFLVGSAELARLGVIDGKAVASTDRERRTELLGVAHLQDQQPKPRHRPPNVDAALLRDKIVQAVLFERVAHPDTHKKEIIGKVGDHYGVGRAYIYRCFKQISPERRAEIERSIIVMTLWPYAMAYMHGVATELIHQRMT